MLRFLYSCYCWFILILFFILHFFSAAILMWFFQDKEYGHMCITRPFIRLGFAMAGIKIEVYGQEHLSKKGPFILMSNHQSLIDILIYLAVIKKKFSFIAKKQLLNVPVLGWDIRMQGHFSIDRNNSRSAVKKLEQIKQEVKKGRSILIFPEGTRSKNDQILPFKRGGFLMAYETGIKIVPCVIKGANFVLPKKKLMLRPGIIKVIIGNPIEVKLGRNVNELMEKIRTEMEGIR